MADQNSNMASRKGEVSGSFLVGLVQSFGNLAIMPLGGNAVQLEQLSPDNWYPLTLFIDILHEIERTLPSFNTLFFRAGMNFLQIWYEHGPGKNMIHSGLEWLHANDISGGYNSVVRGGAPDEIGWCLLRSIDEKAGIAIYENVTPLSLDYVKGVFYGGCVLFDDMDYVTVNGTCEPYLQNSLFNNITITVRFRMKHEATLALESRIAALQPGSTLQLNSEELESLLWNYKNLQYRIDLNEQYFNDINALLKNTVIEAQRINIELETALAHVRELTELLRICAWCHKIRDSNEVWQPVDKYLAENINATFTHGVCPECRAKFLTP